MLKWLALAVPGLVLFTGGQAKIDPPLTYFANHCQRCHGEAGVQYDPTLGKGKTDAWLTQEVKDMADGPGQGSLEGDALKAQVAFHRSIVRKEPFIYVAKMANGVVSGETTPGAKITAIPGGAAKVDGTTWTVKTAAPAKKLVIEAKLGGKTVRLALAKGWYSHSEPLK